jgi:hypothetical protein
MTCHSNSIEEVLSQINLPFVKRGNKFYAKCYLNGKPHHREDKVKVFQKNNVWLIMEEGGDCMSLNKFLKMVSIGETKYITSDYIEPEVIPPRFIKLEWIRDFLHKPNTLKTVFLQYFDSKTIDKVFNEYYVGNELNTLIFFYVNKNKDICYDNRITYNDDGKRDKSSPPYRTYKTGKGYNYKTFFGMHLYTGQDIYIVESEKTCLFLRCLYPDKLFIATGGMNKVFKEEINDLRCDKFLMPDYHPQAIKLWTKKAKTITQCRVFDWWEGMEIIAENDDIMDVMIKNNMI